MFGNLNDSMWQSVTLKANLPLALIASKLLFLGALLPAPPPQRLFVDQGFVQVRVDWLAERPGSGESGMARMGGKAEVGGIAAQP